MRLDKFTLKAHEGLEEAQRFAEEMNHQQIEAEHLLKALLSQSDGIVRPVVERIGANPEMLVSAVDAELKKRPKVYGEAPAGANISQDLKRVLDASEKEAESLHDEYVSTEHILLAMVASKGSVGELLRAFGVTRDSILAILKDLRGGQRVTDQTPEAKFQAIDKYSRDLTALAKKGKLDPVIGRDDESAASSRFSHAARKTTPFLSASQAPARPPSSRDSLSESSTATSPKDSRTNGFLPSTSAPSSPERNSAANSKSD